MGLSCCGRTGGLMGEFPRKSDGRRVFTVEFKRGVVQQLLKGEKTLAEVSRELDIQPSVVRQWKRRFEAGATAAVATNQEVVPVSALRDAHQRIRELERLAGQEAKGDRDPAGGACLTNWEQITPKESEEAYLLTFFDDEHWLVEKVGVCLADQSDPRHDPI